MTVEEFSKELVRQANLRIYGGMMIRSYIEELFKEDEVRAQHFYNAVLLTNKKFLKGALFCEVEKKTELTHEEIKDTEKFLSTLPRFYI
jgi:hypothetical protein